MGAGHSVILKQFKLALLAYIAQAVLGVPQLASGKPVLQSPEFQFIKDKLSQKLQKTDLAPIHLASHAIVAGANEMGLDPLLLLAVIEQESRFRADAVGAVGEIGLMQIRPKTAEWIMSKHGLVFKGKDSLFDPLENIKIGVLYLTWLHRKFGTPEVAISAYNMGPIAAQRFVRQNIIPKIYFEKVQAKYQNLKEESQFVSSRCQPAGFNASTLLAAN